MNLVGFDVGFNRVLGLIITVWERLSRTSSLQKSLAFFSGEALDRVSDGRPWNRRPIAAQMIFKPSRVHLARLAQCPSDGFVNQVVRIGTKRLRILIRNVQR